MFTWRTDIKTENDDEEMCNLFYSISDHDLANKSVTSQANAYTDNAKR